MNFLRRSGPLRTSHHQTSSRANGQARYMGGNHFSGVSFSRLRPFNIVTKVVRVCFERHEFLFYNLDDGVFSVREVDCGGRT